MRHGLPKTLTAILVVWVVAVAGAIAIKTDLAFMFAYYVLPFSALVVPLIVGAIAVQSWPARYSGGSDIADRKAATVAAVASAFMAYLLAYAVLARMLEIPWRLAKFGDGTLSLGFTAATLYGVAALAVFAVALFLLPRVRWRSRAWQGVIASIGMLAFSSALYFCVGISPLVQWRE